MLVVINILNDKSLYFKRKLLGKVSFSRKSAYTCLLKLLTCLYSGLLIPALIKEICDTILMFKRLSSSARTLCGIHGETFDKRMRVAGETSKRAANNLSPIVTPL